MPFVGEIASILTAFCWSANSVCFAVAGRRVGSATVNVVRLTIAVVAMVAIHLVLFGTVFPWHAGTSRLMWLGLSGFIGFALGDAVLFEAFVLLGPRLSMLIMTLWPAMGAVMAWAFLGQHMGALKVAAMVVTLGGLALVVADRGSAMDEGKPRRFALGVMLALGGALGQAVGFVFSKFGMEGDFSPVSANLIRVCAGTFTLGIWQVVRGSLISNFQRLQDGRAALYIVVGAILGPVVGVVLSLFAITHARYLGVASTLMSLSPVILLPVGILFFKERVTLRAILGTVVTLAGAAALFF